MIILFTNIIPEHPCDSGMIRTELRFQQPYTNQVYNIVEKTAVHVCMLSENWCDSYCSKEMFENKQNV